MKKILINRNGQLRSGWKIIVVTVLAVLFVNIPAALFSESVNTEILLVMQSFGFILAILLVLKYIDRKSFRDIGLTGISEHWGELAFGLAAGSVSMTAVFLGMLWTGKAHIISISTESICLGLYGLATFTLVAAGEELMFRGYYINALQQAVNKELAVFLSSVLFALAHMGNQGATLLAGVNIFLVGSLFAYMYFRTGSLWMPIGYHITWNYFQGNVYGLTVSGHEVHSVLTTGVEESIISGGAFGPEGGILSTVVMVLGFLAVRLYRVKEI